MLKCFLIYAIRDAGGAIWKQITWALQQRLEPYWKLST